MTRGLKLRGGGKKGPTARKCLQPKQGLVFQPPPPQRSASTTNHLHSSSLSLSSLCPFFTLFIPLFLFFASTLLCSLKYHFALLIVIMAKIKAECVLASTISHCSLTGRSEMLRFLFCWSVRVHGALPGAGTHCKLQKASTYTV